MTTKPQTLLPLPDPPEREPDDMTSVQHLGENGNLHHLVQYLGNPETTMVSGERYIVPVPGTPSNQRIAPDMLISFNSDPALYRQDNGYVISRQGKPPDLVMEIASERTGKNDVEDKPARYAALASRNTGGSTRPATSTGPSWPETGWCRAGTSQSPSRRSRTESYRATAPRWVCW